MNLFHSYVKTRFDNCHDCNLNANYIQVCDCNGCKCNRYTIKCFNDCEDAFSIIVVEVLFNPIRSGLFQTANDPGGNEVVRGGVFKSPPPPLRSRKLYC